MIFKIFNIGHQMVELPVKKESVFRRKTKYVIDY